MDSFEVNKIIGAVLGTLFMLFSIALVSEAVFHAPAPATPGYAIQAAESEAPATVGGDAAGESAPEAIVGMIATADPAAGEAVFSKCQACHNGEKGGPNKVGPNLWGVVNRPIASHEGFSYSAAIKEFSQGGAQVWDYTHLAGFIHAPKAYIKGTAMGFAGVKKAEDLANLIAYLRTLADTPAPLPAAPATPPDSNSTATDQQAPIQEAPATAEPDKPQ